ncbi:fulicin-like neuropeptide precursor [Aplysia californica]|uniref:Fulicin-like neuropeptide n=1 Tax=Aplysia californica TaxID=6500 RepID=Q5MAR5_APLCA|nr:fulicin-like neuropeptide precursor [Aplysia californica]AAW30458.1 fulicin-like neuropeptide precursor [Aplysia californica]
MCTRPGLAALLVLMTSCASSFSRADTTKTGHLKRPTRSSDQFFDRSDTEPLQPPNSDQYLSSLKNKGQFSNEQYPGEYFDGSGFNAEEEERPLHQGDGDSVSLLGDSPPSPAMSKRFTEFLGKRVPLANSGMPGPVEEPHKETVEDSHRSEGLSPSERSYRDMAEKLALLLRSDAKRQWEFVGKRPYDFVGKRYDFVGKRYDFVGKRYDFLGKRNPYEFIGKRYDFVGKRRPYDFLGKKSYDFLGKRYDFLGKRNPYEFVGKRTPAMVHEGVISHNLDGEGQKLAIPSSDAHTADRRYAEFLGKRSEESGQAALTDSARLAALLSNTGLRKRLSRMLLNGQLAEQYPEFIGK